MSRVRLVAGGLALSLILTFIGFAAPATGNGFIYPNPSPGATGIRNSQLPNCSSINGTKANEMAGQGWVGDYVLPTASGLRNGAAYLMLPCWNTGATAGPQIFANIWVLNDSGAYVVVTNQVQILMAKYTCNGTDQLDTGAPFNYSGGIPNSTVSTWVQGSNTAPNFCKTATSVLTKIQINWRTNSDSLGSVLGTATWTPAAWTNGTPVTKPTSLGTVPMPNGGETPVVCPYTIVTTSVLDALSSFFVTFGPWVICLLTPAGWDRSKQIPAAFELGGISRTDDMFSAVIPTAGSIYCGDILTASLGWINFGINNCALVAATPSWIRIAIGAVCILGMLLLFVRRIQWTVTL